MPAVVLVPHRSRPQAAYLARRTLAWLEANGKLKDSDADDYEDRLVAAWQAKTAELPKQTS